MEVSESLNSPVGLDAISELNRCGVALGPRLYQESQDMEGAGDVQRRKRNDFMLNKKSHLQGYRNHDHQM